MAQEILDSGVAIDHQFLNRLRVVGVWDACQALNINFDTVFAPLANHVNHPYKHYRWSITCDINGETMMSAMPPEEESGWTPWECWSIEEGKPKHTEWVPYPDKTPIMRSMIQW